MSVLSSCTHANIHTEEYTSFCVDCGYEYADDSTVSSSSDTSTYSTTNNNNKTLVFFNDYLAHLPVNIKHRIVDTFDKILLVEKENVRGTGRRALLAICYLYVCREENYNVTSYQVCQHFCVVVNGVCVALNKKKFGEARKTFLHHHPKYRTMVTRIDDFVKEIVKTFDANEYANELTERARVAEDSQRLVNYNPYSVCACILFELLPEMKKCNFTSRVNISDKTINNIFRLLHPPSVSLYVGG
jgi:hypothetical protein